jgi:hypothetical protein
MLIGAKGNRHFCFCGELVSIAHGNLYAPYSACTDPSPFTSSIHRFADDPTKLQQWAAFVQDVANLGSLADVVETLAVFLMSHGHRAAD